METDEAVGGKSGGRSGEGVSTESEAAVDPTILYDILSRQYGGMREIRGEKSPLFLWIDTIVNIDVLSMYVALL